jgi:hypothetical protein
MPPQLMRSVLLTYSDIVSRYFAMRFVLEAAQPGHDVVITRDQEVSPTLDEIVEALGHGAPAARRFDADLANTKALARRIALRHVGPRSRAAAEVSVRVENIDGANGCCLESGGSVFTDLATLRWTGGRPGRSYTGTVSGIGFHVTWTGHRWHTELEAG